MGKLILTGNSRIRVRHAVLAGGIQPTDVADLHTWYDAATTGDITKNGSDQVTAWIGHSGFGSTLSCSATNAIKSGIDTKNSRNVVTFASGYIGNSSPMMYATLNSGSGNKAVTVFMVVDPTTTSGTGLETFVAETNSSDLSSQLNFRAQTISSPSNEYIISGAKAGVGQWITAQSGSGVVGTGYHLLVAQLDTVPASDTWATRIDRAAGNSGTFTINTTTTINAFGLGGLLFSGGASHFLIGHIAEVLIYTRKLTSTEITDLEGYLATKWGL